MQHTFGGFLIRYQLREI